MATTSSFKSIENKHYVYRDEDWMKNFCETLRDHAMNLVNFEKKKRSFSQKKSRRKHMKMQKYADKYADF